MLDQGGGALRVGDTDGRGQEGHQEPFFDSLLR